MATAYSVLHPAMTLPGGFSTQSHMICALHREQRTAKRPLSDTTNCFAQPAPKKTRTSPRKQKTSSPLANSSSSSSSTQVNNCTFGTTNGPCIHLTTQQPPEWSEWIWKFDKEAEYAPPADLGIETRHPELSSRMRSVLFEWMGEVCHEHYLQTQTYHMAVNYVSRYLYAVENVPRSEFQLIGATALLIAAKIQEVHPPHTTELAELTLGACTATQIAEKELEMVQALRWRLCPQTVSDWVMQFFEDTPLELQQKQPIQQHEHVPLRKRTPRKAKATATHVYCDDDHDRLRATYEQLQHEQRGHVASLTQRFTLSPPALLAYHRAMAVCNVATLSPTSCEYPPSMIAAAALTTTGANVPVEQLVVASGYHPSVVTSCVAWLKTITTSLRKQGALPDEKTVRNDALCHTRVPNSLALLESIPE